MSHRIEKFDVRRTILDFGSGFCSGSIAGGVLRNSHSLPLDIRYELRSKHLRRVRTAEDTMLTEKLLGVSVMTKTEGVSTALSILLSRFEQLPKVVYYDNSFNMERSIVLRTP